MSHYSISVSDMSMLLVNESGHIYSRTIDWYHWQNAP